MESIRETKVIPYLPSQLFAIVNDIEHYPAFLPYCEETIVHYRDEDEVQATIVLGAMGIQKSFTTRNRVQMNKMIEMRLVDGPFSHLEGFWKFDAEGESSCLVTFELDYEFNQRLLAMMLGPVFEETMHKTLDAFNARAKECYGA